MFALAAAPARAAVTLAGVTRLQENVPLDFLPGDRIDAVVAEGRRVDVADSVVWRRLEATAMTRGETTLIGMRGTVPRSWQVPAGAARFAVRDVDVPAARRALVETARSLARGEAAPVPDLGEPDERAALLLRAAHNALERNELDAAHAAAARGLALAIDPVLRAQLLEAAAGTQMRPDGSIEAADAQLEEAQTLLRTHAADSPALASIYFRRSQLAAWKGQVNEARRWIDACVALLRRQAGPSLQLANALFAQSFRLELTDSESGAVEISREMAAIAERLGAPPADRARYYALLASDELRAGNLDAATRAAQAAVDAANQPGMPPLARSAAWLALGEVQVSAGRQRDGEHAFRQALEQARLAPSDPNAQQGSQIALQNLAGIARTRGDLESARALYSEALTLNRAGAVDAVAVARSLTLLGSVEADRGDLDAAIALYDEAAALEQGIGAEGRTHALTQLRLGELHLAKGELEAAEAAFARADRFGSRLSQDHPLRAIVLQQRAALETARGRPRDAVQLLDRALAIAKRHEPGSLRVAALQQLRGAALIDAGDLDAAAASLEIARTTQEKQAPDSITLARTRYLQARIHALRGRLQTARTGYCTAADILDRVRIPLTADSYAMAQFRAQFGEIYQACLAAWHDAGDDVEGLRMLERFRGRGFLTAMQSRELATLAAPVPSSVPPPPSARELMHAVPRGAVALSFAVLADRTLVFRITPETIDGIELRPGSAQLEEDIARFRRTIARRDLRDLPELENDGARLYAQLLAPALRDDRPTQLLIAPDGPLHDLPFAALRDADGRWLGATVPLVVIDALTVEAAMPRGGAAGRGFVGVADARVASLPTLPGAHEEVQRAARHYGSSARIFTGPEATESAVRAQMADAGVLHLAVHATLQSARPLESAIELTPAAPDGDGRLHLWEVLEQVRLDAGLVVLSGCNTAVGRRFVGEGLFGFARAFRFAGARRVIATLWPVQDRATATLMNSFYEARAGGVDDAEALRRAIAATAQAGSMPAAAMRGVGAVRPRDSRDTAALAHPYYWAAFQLYGTAWHSSRP